jgi:hypothetical protein
LRSANEIFAKGKYEMCLRHIAVSSLGIFKKIIPSIQKCGTGFAPMPHSFSQNHWGFTRPSPYPYLFSATPQGSSKVLCQAFFQESV